MAFKNDRQRKKVMATLGRKGRAVSKSRSKVLDVRAIEPDLWGRDRYKNVRNNNIYVMVDGTLHTMTSEGEPDDPIKNKIKIIDKKSIAVAHMKTADGVIKGSVEWNPSFKQYHLTIDGSNYGHYDNFEDGFEELEGSGFKDIKIK